uniref:Integrin alpha-PS1 n=1 Tax=Melanaphis sacchari TaxID=742174 RepID=A0A2H8TK76_9HEMI
MMSLSLLLLLLCDSAFRVRSFNLETRLPIVKRSLEVSYFGYSVAGHQSYDEIKLQVENSWILVGAPIGKNLQPKTNQSGALYKCPLTSFHDDCIQVVTDGKRNLSERALQKIPCCTMSEMTNLWSYKILIWNLNYLN